MMAFGGEVRELHHTALLPHHLRLLDHHADPGAVDVGDAIEIDDELHPPGAYQLVDVATERQVAVVHGDLTAKGENSDVAFLTLDNLKFGRQGRKLSIRATVLSEDSGA